MLHLLARPNRSLFVILSLATIVTLAASCAPIAPTPIPPTATSQAAIQPTAVPATAVPPASPPVPTPTPLAPAPTAAPTTAPLPGPSPTARPAGRWQAFTNGNFVRGVAPLDGRIYAATEGGVVAWDASTGEALRKWTTLDGLSHNLATSIVACPIPEMRLVVGTEKGLSIYDPKADAWKRQTRADSGMAADEVAALLCDARTGLLVIGYDSAGIDLFDSKAGTWRHVGEKQGLASDYVNAMAMSPDGKDVWVASPFGATLISGQTVKVYDSKATKLASDGVSGIAVDGAGSVWWGMLEGLVRFSKGAYKLVTDKTVPGFPFGTITVLAPAPDGSLWAGTGFGDLCRLDAAAQKCLPITGLPGVTSGLNNLSADAAGNLYYATDGSGVSRYDGKAWRQYLVPGESLASNRISAITQDKEGHIWIATDSGANRVNPAIERAAWEHITAADQGLPDNVISAVYPSPGGGVWMAAGAPALLEGGKWTVLTVDKGLLAGGRHRHHHRRQRACVVRHTRRHQHLGRQEGDQPAEEGRPARRPHPGAAGGEGHHSGPARRRPCCGTTGSSGRPSRSATASQVPMSACWRVRRTAICWSGPAAGLASFDGRQAKLIPDVVQDYITSIAVAPDGSVWVGTMAGAYRLSGGQWKRFTTADGLPTNRVMAVFVDRAGSVWIGGDGAGVAVYRP